MEQLSHRRSAAPSHWRAAASLPFMLVLFIVVGGWVAAASTGLLATGSRIAIFLLASLILSFDVIDLLVRLWLRGLHGAAATGPSVELGLPEISNAERTFGLAPYAVIASIHNEAPEVDRLTHALAPFKDVVWLIDDASGDTTLLRLRRDGWNCIAGVVNRKKPAALAHLLTLLPPEIQTVMILDPDVHWVGTDGNERAVLERVISDLQRCGAAACTPRVQVGAGGWLLECQAFEYELACGLGRKCLRDLVCNSGVSVYQRAALQEALSRHSLSVYAEDFEISLLLLAAGYRIYYDDRLVLETAGKPAFASLLSQRVGWAFGAIKVLIERLPQVARIASRSPLAAYQYVMYLAIGGMLLLPLKLLSIAMIVASLLRAIDDLLMTNLFSPYAWNDPLLFAIWYVKSTLVLLVACFAATPRGQRARHFTAIPFYSFYALLQYVPITIGYLNMLTLWLSGRRLYTDHYESHPRLIGRHALARSVEPA